MKAIILTAGFGRRMRPLTNDNHKTLLKIGEMTIIEKIIDGLLENEVTDIVIVTGYLKERLERFILDKYPKIDFTFVHNEIYDKTNNIYSVALAFEQIEINDDILLIESDLIYHPDIIKSIISDPRENVALVDNYQQGMDGTVVSIEDDIITSVIPPHLQGHDFNFSDKYKTLNIYKFGEKFAAHEFKKLLTYYAQVIDDNCYYELILGILIYMQQQKIYALKCNGLEWAEVDDPNDLSSASFIFEKDKQLEILEDSFGGYWNYDIVDFCFIRNMYFPGGSILSEFKNNLESLLWNYGTKQNILDRKMSYFLCCEEQNVIALNGASQVYPILKNYLKGKKAIIPNPTFGEYYRLFDSYDTYEEVGDNPVDLSIVFQSDAEVIVFVNPNNPTGREFNSNEILSLAKKYPHKFVLVDESFIEFSENESLLPRIEEDEVSNVLIIKSLSKSLGLPGIRLGYVYSTNKEVNHYIRQNVPIWNMNSLAEFYMEALLKNRQEIEESIEQTKNDRAVFSERLSELEITDKVFESGANFLLIRLTISVDELITIQKRLLAEHKIYIKNASDKFSDHKAYIRLAVRTISENNQFVEVLKKLSEN